MLTHSKNDLHYWQMLAMLTPELLSRLRSYMVMSLTDCEFEVFLLTTDDRLYAYGFNKHGALGLGHRDKVTEPTEIVELREKGVIDLQHGSCHVLALTRDGHIYSWGCNYSGELGLGYERSNEVFKPSLVPIENQFFISISSGVWQNLALTNEGKLFVWGENSQAQLGLGHRTNQHTPILHPELSEHFITKAVAGYYHSVVLNDRGELYVWGNNIDKQIGIETDDYYITKPTKFKLPEGFQIKSITCGSGSILLLNADGELYLIGGKRWEEDYKFRKVNVENVRFVAIASHFQSNFCSAMSDTGHCYIFGLLNNLRDQKVCIPMKTDLTSLSDAFAYYSQDRVTPYLVPYSSQYLYYNPRLQNVSDKLSVEVFDNPDQSDFEMLVEGKTIYVHRLVLAVGCRYFQQKLAAEWTNLNKIEIDQYSYSTYFKYLRSLYCATLDTDSSNKEELIQLLHLAIKYRDDQLKLKINSLLRNLFLNSNLTQTMAELAKFDWNLEEFRRQISLIKVS